MNVNEVHQTLQRAFNEMLLLMGNLERDTPPNAAFHCGQAIAYIYMSLNEVEREIDKVKK